MVIVQEIKELINELEVNVEVYTSAGRVNWLIKDLRSVLDSQVEPLEEQALKTSIESLIRQSWDDWGRKCFAVEKWQYPPSLMFWLDFQNDLTKKNLLPEDFLYKQLGACYTKVHSALRLDDLKALIIYCARVIGYADRGEKNYPFLRLQIKTKAQMQPPTIVPGLECAISSLRTLFYLLDNYCSPRHWDLLPFLLYFRPQTTQEERRSEILILNKFREAPEECLAFFCDNKEKVQGRLLREIPEITKVSCWLPQKIQDLAKYIPPRQSPSLWDYYLEVCKNRLMAGNNRLISLNKTQEALSKEFAVQENQSYAASLNFAHQVKDTMDGLLQHKKITQDEARIFYMALYWFCWDEYLKMRQEGPGIEDANLPFSREVKCSAANKKRLLIQENSVSFTFFERIALNQGRMKHLVDTFENTKTGISLS